MGCHGAPVEEAGRGEGEGAGADGRDPGPPRVRVAQRIQQRWWWAFPNLARRGHDHSISLDQRLEPKAPVEERPLAGPGGAFLDSAKLHLVEPRHRGIRSAAPEHLTRNGELEDGDSRGDGYGNPVHGRFLPQSVLSVTRRGCLAGIAWNHAYRDRPESPPESSELDRPGDRLRGVGHYLSGDSRRRPSPSAALPCGGQVPARRRRALSDRMAAASRCTSRRLGNATPPGQLNVTVSRVMCPARSVKRSVPPLPVLRQRCFMTGSLPPVVAVPSSWMPSSGGLVA
jgi:hypothetical protein